MFYSYVRTWFTSKYPSGRNSFNTEIKDVLFLPESEIQSTVNGMCRYSYLPKNVMCLICPYAFEYILECFRLKYFVPDEPFSFYPVNSSYFSICTIIACFTWFITTLFYFYTQCEDDFHLLDVFSLFNLPKIFQFSFLPNNSNKQTSFVFQFKLTTHLWARLFPSSPKTLLIKCYGQVISV